jgi:hypothetical protein
LWWGARSLIFPHDPTRTRRRSEETMGDLLPGGYVFTHLIFWAVVGMVALGTNAVAIILVIGLGMLVLEAFQRA